MIKFILNIILILITVTITNQSVDAQIDNSHHYNLVEEHFYDRNSGDYIKKQVYKANGKITVKNKRLEISGDINIPEGIYRVVSEHRDAGTDTSIYICYRNNKRVTLTYSPGNRIFSVLDANKKLVFKIQ